MPNKSPGFWPNKEPVVDVFPVVEPNRDPLDPAGKPNAVVDLEDDIESGPEPNNPVFCD